MSMTCGDLHELQAFQAMSARPEDDHKPAARIWAWPFNPGWGGGYYRESKNAATPEKNGAEYVLATDREALEAALARLD